MGGVGNATAHQHEGSFGVGCVKYFSPSDLAEIDELLLLADASPEQEEYVIFDLWHRYCLTIREARSLWQESNSIEEP